MAVWQALGRWGAEWDDRPIIFGGKPSGSQVRPALWSHAWRERQGVSMQEHVGRQVGPFPCELRGMGVASGVHVRP